MSRCLVFGRGWAWTPPLHVSARVFGGGATNEGADGRHRSPPPPPMQRGASAPTATHKRPPRRNKASLSPHLNPLNLSIYVCIEPIEHYTGQPTSHENFAISAPYVLPPPGIVDSPRYGKNSFIHLFIGLITKYTANRKKKKRGNMMNEKTICI
jgi:hypothetical protein